MSESSEREQEKRDAEAESKPKHYFDACTLSVEEFLVQITNASKHGFTPTTSHLAVGEAICSEVFKLKEIEGKLKYAKNNNKIAELAREKEAKIELIKYITELAQKMHVVGNDAPIKLVKEFVDDSGPMSLDMTDAINIATAINAGCQKFFTTDSDFKGERFREGVDTISRNYNGKSLDIIYKETS